MAGKIFKAFFPEVSNHRRKTQKKEVNPMKLYGDFNRQDWMEAIKMDEKSIPSSFILHGELEHEWNISTGRMRDW